MLCAKEFTVGTLADAKPPCLMLPLADHESPMLIGQAYGSSAAVFLAGEYSFHSFNCSNDKAWQGILISNIRIEVDETSLFDPQAASAHLGMLVRTDTLLTLITRNDHSHGRRSKVILETALPPTHDLSAGFSKWRVLVGEGKDRRVLREIDAGKELQR